MEKQVNQNAFKSLSRQLWILAFVIVLVVIVFNSFFYFNYNKSNLQTQAMLRQLLDSAVHPPETRPQNDSIKILSYAIATNKRLQDSLRNRINSAIDSLDQLETKLQVLLENSDITTEIMSGIIDSIEIYRAETVVLKQKIDSLNFENARLLQIERDSNAALRQQIAQYEKRLMALFPLNIRATTYKDGFDQNRRLITTDEARKVREIVVEFSASRTIDPDDEFVLELVRNNNTLMTVSKFNTSNRMVTISMKIDSSEKLSPGTYYLNIKHTNLTYSINNESLGRLKLQLK